MPKLRCPCGFTHNLTPIPDDSWRTLRDVDLDLHREAIERREASAITLSGLLYECLQCGRLMWQKPGETKFVVYARESSATKP
jgi:hypothetical protein